MPNYSCTSWLFYGDDRLNAAANHNSAHILPNYNGKGPHVRKIHEVLKDYFSGTFGGEKMPYGDALTGDVYNQDTSVAVWFYKYQQDKNGEDLKNYAGKIDSICGIKTVRSMDAWHRAQNPFNP
ncbi:hypothetical protein [Variovorax sp. PAMC26660]|uniref:hypothetical protein n=1 Tax=Variovorax sp. PAMC26660 TaxID=2762322 RepID=UPI00164E3DEE|nr:hypothetical protein [Variovorax sp. PAMC26660]QNK70959.1 hypothetical protein H7F35_15285 [Variovorax sp. PAMC26660]